MWILPYFLLAVTVLTLGMAALTYFAREDLKPGEHSWVSYAVAGIVGAGATLLTWGEEKPETASNRFLNECGSRVLGRLAQPSTYDAKAVSQDWVGDDLVIAIDFEAGNAFGATIPQRAICVVSDDGMTVEIGDRP